MSGLTDMLVTLAAPQGQGRAWFRWGTVTAVGPLRVRLDGEVDPLDMTPDSLAVVAVGDRVWCQIADRRLVVLGKAVAT